MKSWHTSVFSLLQYLGVTMIQISMQAWSRCVAGGIFLFSALAGAAPVAHVGLAENTTGAYLFDWQTGGRATVVAQQGRAEASVVTSGLQRLATLDSPLSVEYAYVDGDCPEQEYLQRMDTRQIAVTRISGTESRGTSSIVTLGTVTTLTGCNAGRVEPFGDLTDAGLETRHLAMSLRPGLADLTPGAQLAGPSEDPAVISESWAADVVTVQAGSVLFAASGNAHPLSTVDGWLVLGLPAGERAYTRVQVDRRTGAEVWIGADWAAGLPQRVIKERMVKPTSGAGFGSVRQASRMWSSSFSIGSNNPFLIYLYRDGSGQRVSQDLAAGTETRSPITWAFDGLNIVQRRAIGPDTAERTWKPLRNSASTRFVLEEEVRLLPDGTPTIFIKPRVNYYVDTGAATPPPAAR